ncbi:MAG: energy transducer TonB [bacterium]
MKQLISTAIIILLMISCSSTKLISKHELKKKNYQEVIGVILENQLKPDKYALYPNGLKGIYEHIAKTTRYPISARENNIQGQVVVEFIVEKNGQVKEAKILESVSSELDEEALRVILSLERFYPGFKDALPVRVCYRQPISFKLN